MSDYIKREDAINVFDWGMPDADVKCGIAIQNIKDIPSADVVERSSYESMEHTVAKLNEALSNSVDVVRCKDCKYWDNTTKWAVCTRWSDDPYEQADTEKNDFCSYGERKDEGL